MNATVKLLQAEMKKLACEAKRMEAAKQAEVDKLEGLLSAAQRERERCVEEALLAQELQRKAETKCAKAEEERLSVKRSAKLHVSHAEGERDEARQELEKTKAEMERQMAVAVRDKETLTQRVTALEREMVQKEEELVSCRGKITALERQASSLSSEGSALTKTRSVLQEQVADLTTRYEAQRTALTQVGIYIYN